MAKGPFFKRLRPRAPQMESRNPLYVPAYIMDTHSFIVLVCAVVTVISLGAGIAGVVWGARKEARPPQLVAALFDPYGNMVRAWNADNPAANDERMAVFLLRETVFKLRSVVDEPTTKRNLDQVSAMFRDAAANRMREHLRASDYGKPIFSAGLIRQVDYKTVSAGRVPGSEREFFIEWDEFLLRGQNNIEVDGSRKHHTMRVTWVRSAKIPEQLLDMNPFGYFISDFSWDVLPDPGH